jgi:hypothetical protein
MTANYNSLLDHDISSGQYQPIEIVMFCAIYFILGYINETELSTQLQKISWTYGSENKTFSDGTTTYTVNDLFSSCISTVYATSFVLNQSRMKDAIDFAKSSNFLTADEASVLITLL